MDGAERVAQERRRDLFEQAVLLRSTQPVRDDYPPSQGQRLPLALVGDEPLDYFVHALTLTGKDRP